MYVGKAHAGVRETYDGNPKQYSGLSTYTEEHFVLAKRAIINLTALGVLETNDDELYFLKGEYSNGTLEPDLELRAELKQSLR